MGDYRQGLQTRPEFGCSTGCVETTNGPRFVSYGRQHQATRLAYVGRDKVVVEVMLVMPCPGAATRARCTMQQLSPRRAILGMQEQPRAAAGARGPAHRRSQHLPIRALFPRAWPHQAHSAVLGSSWPQLISFAKLVDSMQVSTPHPRKIVFLASLSPRYSVPGRQHLHTGSSPWVMGVRRRLEDRNDSAMPIVEHAVRIAVSISRSV